MFPYEIEEALKTAAARTDEAIRRDLEGLPERWAKILQEIRRTLYDPSCSVDAARRAAGIGDTAVPARLGAHLGMPLEHYVKTRRIETAKDAVAEGRIPVGLLARALGIRSYHSFERAFQDVTGEKLPVVRAPELLTADFDYYTLRQAREHRLGTEARSLVRHLAETLRRDHFPGVRTTPSDPWTPPDPQVPVVVEGDDDTLQQWCLALAEAQARFRRDADLLPARLTGAFFKIAERFYLHDFSTQGCCKAAGLRDTSATSQARCYLGDPFSAYVEKRRVTMAARLLAIDASAIGDDWIRGRVLALRASYLEVRGQADDALADLAAGSLCFKRAGDELERCRCAVQRAIALSARGVNPCRLLTACIRQLEGLTGGTASILRESAHVNRLLSGLYFQDRLTGRQQDLLERWRNQVPANLSAAAKANLAQVDGMLAYFRTEIESAIGHLTEAGKWFEKTDMLADAAVAYLQRALCELDRAPERAGVTLGLACDYLKKTRFRSHALHLAAEVCRKPTREKLRQLILVVVGVARHHSYATSR